MNRESLRTDKMTFHEIMDAAATGDTGFFTDAGMSRYAVETMRYAKEQIDHANRNADFAKTMRDPSYYRTLIRLCWAVIAMRHRLKESHHAAYDGGDRVMNPPRRGSE